MEAIIVILVLIVPGVLLMIRARYQFGRYAITALILATMFIQLGSGHFSDVVLRIGAFPGWATAWVVLVILAWWYPVYRRNAARRKTLEERLEADAAIEQAGLLAAEKKAKRIKRRKAG